MNMRNMVLAMLGIFGFCLVIGIASCNIRQINDINNSAPQSPANTSYGGVELQYTVTTDIWQFLNEKKEKASETSAETAYDNAVYSEIYDDDGNLIGYVPAQDSAPEETSPAE